jgi:hypothetical protein
MFRYLSLIFVVVCTAILFTQLVLPPTVGLANNADFGKLIARFDLGDDHPFAFANTQYKFDRKYYYTSEFLSSELLLILPALGLNRLLADNGTFDLRIQGAVHGALFLAALVLFVPLLGQTVPKITCLALFAAIAFTFCDVMYVSYLNSFYMDVTAYLFILLAVVLYLRVLRWGRNWEAVLLVGCAAMATASKPQYALIGPWFALLFWIARGGLWRGRKTPAAAAAIALLVTTWATLEYGAPRTYTAKGSFTVVFTGILPRSANPAQTLAELGLDDSYRKWIGKNAYSPGTRLEDPGFYIPYLEKVPYSRIARYYLEHPATAFSIFRASLDETGRHRPAFGNFDMHSGRAPGTESQSFAWSSTLKRRIYHHHGMRLLVSFVVLAAIFVLLLVRLRHKLPAGAVAGGLVFVGMACMNLTAGAIADVHDSPRHQLVFYAQFDIILIADIWLVVRSLERRLGGLKIARLFRSRALAEQEVAS